MKQKNLPSRKRQKKVSRQPSNVVDALLTGAIAKVKTEAEAEIAKVKAQTDEVINKFDFRTKERRRALTDTRAKNRPSDKVSALFLEAIAKQKAKSEAEIAEALARVKVEAKAKTDTVKKTGTKAPVKKKPAKPKSKAKTSKPTAKAKAKAKTITKPKAKTNTKKKPKVKPSSKVEALFSKAVAKQKAKTEAETARAIAKAKAEAKTKTEAKEKAKTDTDTKSKARPSSQVEELLQDAVAKQKVKSEAEIAEAIARVKAETEEVLAKQKTESEAETANAIAKVKAEAEEAIAKVKAETEERTRAYTDTKAEVETEAVEVTGEQKPDSGAVVDEESIADTDAIIKVPFEAEEEPNADNEATVKGTSEVEEALEAVTEATAQVKSEVEEARAKQKRKSESEACEAIARVKAEAIEAITKAQAKAEEETAVYTVTIAKVKGGEKSATIFKSNDQSICEPQTISQALKVLPEEYFVKDSSSPLYGLLQNENISLNAQDIMQKELVWGNADDSVRQTFSKMQQHNASYVMVGHDGILEGIVSKSDITGATSPYLQPVFSRRRQFLDDASLQIRIRWIMSRPVYIISPQTSLEVIIRHMCQFRRLCLPVVDQQSNVLGLVSQANILQALLQLQGSSGVSVSGHPPQDSMAQANMTMETAPVYSQ